MNWEKREKVTNATEATEAISDYLSSSAGISAAMGNKLDEVETFAHKWGIPFSRELVSKMVSAMDHKRWNGDPGSLAEYLDVYREDFSSDEAFEKALEEAAQQYEDRNWYRPKGDHRWMSSSETAMC